MNTGNVEDCIFAKIVNSLLTILQEHRGRFSVFIVGLNFLILSVDYSVHREPSPV